MEKRAEKAYLLVYKKSYRKLLLVLPTDIDSIVPLIKDKDSLSRAVITNCATREERTRCLLEFVMEELNGGRAASFEQLLEVIAAHQDASSNIVVDRVLQSIQTDVKTVLSQSDQISHNEELLPNLKEQFFQQLKQEVLSSYTLKHSTVTVSPSVGITRQNVYPDTAIFDNLARTEAISKLQEQCHNGMYLIRSNPNIAPMILSVWTGGINGRARHYKIFFDQDTHHYSFTIGCSFPDIPSLLTHYHTNDLPRSECSLTVPYGYAQQ